MNRALNIILCLVACMMLATTSSFARRAHKGEMPPKALLVELMTRKNQVDHISRNLPKRLPILKKDIEEVMKATVDDFANNFEYIPVFFFVDTNADKIMAGKFEGVLLDENMQPVKQTVLAENDTNFFVAYFGSFMPQPEEVKIDESAKLGLKGGGIAEGDDPTALKKTLLVMDHNFKLLKLPRPRTVKGVSRYATLNSNARTYHSKFFDIDYTPQAEAYDKTMYRYYRGKRQ